MIKFHSNNQPHKYNNNPNSSLFQSINFKVTSYFYNNNNNNNNINNNNIYYNKVCDD